MGIAIFSFFGKLNPKPYKPSHAPTLNTGISGHGPSHVLGDGLLHVLRKLQVLLVLLSRMGSGFRVAGLPHFQAKPLHIPHALPAPPTPTKREACIERVFNNKIAVPRGVVPALQQIKGCVVGFKELRAASPWGKIPAPLC